MSKYYSFNKLKTKHLLKILFNIFSCILSFVIQLGVIVFDL